MMKKLLTLGLLAAFLMMVAGCDKLRARDNLNKGIKAFKEGHFERAVDFFTTATQLDPELTNAELYLATAYAQQYIPGAPSEENQKFADNAIQTFEKVLQKDPKNTHAVAGIAGIYQSQLQFQKAREYYKKQTEIEPTNPTPFYAIGSLAWYIVYDKNAPPPLTDQPPIVEDGLDSLNKALALNPDYDEAMTYMNLLLREKARLTPSEEEKKKLMSEADEWFNRAIATRAKNAEKQKTATPAG
jgi:tetratricopeptide (TPR) repeat protein